MKKILYLFLTVLIVGCSDDDGNPCLYNPTLTTSAVTNITETSATLNGVISIVSQNCDDPNNTEQGFVYATTIQPTIANTKVNINGTDITTTLENLEPNTTYYARTFLTNAFGEFYGNEVSFITSSQYKFILSFTGNNKNEYCPNSQSDYWYYSGNYSFDKEDYIFFQGEGFSLYTWVNEGENVCNENLEINLEIGNDGSQYTGMSGQVSLSIINISLGQQIVNQDLDDLYICPNSSVTNHIINFNPQNNSLTVITN